MFRESDYFEPRVHASFGIKKIPHLQQVAQQMKFEDSRSELRPQAEYEEPVVIPTTHDTKYDPNDPRADWAGLVSRSNPERRHITNHPSQQTSIIVTKDGVVGKSERQEWSRINRNHAPKDRPSQDIIGGIPSKPEEAYATNYRRQIIGESTSQDQLSMFKHPDKKRHIPNPAEQHTLSSIATEVSRPGLPTSKSYISNIAASLADVIPDMPKPPQKDSLAMPISGYTGYRGNRR